MALNRFAHAIDVQQFFIAKILHTTNGGWICSIGDSEVFLPESQLYNDIEDYEAYAGKSVKVMVQRANRWSTVVSHKDYIKKIFERKNIISNLQRGQKLFGIIKGITEKGYQINVMGIIGFMHKEEMCEPDNYGINSPIEFSVQKADPEKSILLLSQKLLKTQEHHASKEQEKINTERISKEFISKLEINQVLTGLIKRAVLSGYIVEFSDGITALLRSKDIPSKYKIEEGTSIDVAVSEINIDKLLFFVSISRLLENKWLGIKKIVDDNLIPNETIVIGRVVFLEKDLVTLRIILGSTTIYGYIKSEDLAWEKVLNASDFVYLNEDLEVKYLYSDQHKFFFDLKWQSEKVYPKELFDMDVDELLLTLNIHENKFIAKVSKRYDNKTSKSEPTISGAIAKNIIPASESDKNIQFVDKYTGTNITALIPMRYAYGLEDGKYYTFSLDVASLERREKEHRPYMFSAQLTGGAIALPDPFKEQVEKSFKENKTPKSNRESASYLKEIGADMYTDRDRMFYELLQNADDSSSPRGVKVMVQVKDNYLIFTHDGLSFSRQDFRSIVSTANSTKRLDRKKTGYKGIGFKSVFTDSERVFIKTAGFFFVFDKKAQIFNNFREFYRYVNPMYTEEQLQLFFEENRDNEEEFEGVDHLPWQLLPFWVDECPDALRGTSFMRNCNVAIALEMDASVDKHREIIKGIIKKPRFMLFLRNTLRIQFGEKKWELLSIAKQEDKQTGIVKLKNSFDETEEEVSYIVKEGCNIVVSNDNFEKCGIPMKKECRKLGGREKWSMYQIVDNTEIPITSIPERVIAADTTALSYAFMLDEDERAIPIPDKTPSLYAYLPMEDRRYLFPFYINADFELSSNRQNAKQVSVWNEFLFYNIGKNIVSWVASLASAAHPSYLSLLPKEFLVEELEESKIDKLATQFNRGYTEALSSTPFILNDKGNVVSQSDIVIDESGFANIIGATDFCNLFGLTKRMVNREINIEPLYNLAIFTGIEHLQTSYVVERILDKKNRISILRYWLSISKDLRSLLLGHIANMPGKRKNLDDQLSDIPAYTSKGKLYSYNKLLASHNIILRTNAIKGIEELLLKLGFEITDENASTHAFTQKLEEQINAYTLHLFDIVAEKTRTDAYKLSAQEKSSLFVYFASNKMDVKHEVLSAWEIFSNQNGKTMPVSELTHMDSSLYNDITKEYVIDEPEYLAVGKSLDRYLMKEQDQFDKVVVNKWDAFVKMIEGNKEKAMSLYLLASTTYTVAKHEQAKDNSKGYFSDKNCAFVSETMHNLNDVILSSSIASECDVIPIIESLTDKLVVSDTVLKALQKEPFNCNEHNLEHISLSSDTILSKDQVVILLDYCQRKSETIFCHYFIKEVEEGYVFSMINKGQCIAYTNNATLKTFIENNCRSIILLQECFSKYSDVRGILTEEELLLKVLDIVQDVKPHAATLLPIYKESISSVKRAYIEHISSIQMNDSSFTEDSDVNLQHLFMASTIEKPDGILFDKLRSLMHVVSDDNVYALSSIKLQHTIELNGQKFPLSKLLPNEDKIAMLVDTLKERLEEKHLNQTFIDNLFGDEVDDDRADDVFAQLNKSGFILENGVQLAFVIKYAQDSKLKKSVICNVHDAASTPQSHSLSCHWYLNGEMFIDEGHILSSKYQDVAKYLLLPYSNKSSGCVIKANVDDFQYVKNLLSAEESDKLLDRILEIHQKGVKPSNEDLQRIKAVLGMADKEYVLSADYSLPSEILPEAITKWEPSSDQGKKNSLLKNVFGVHTEDSDIVKVRVFLDKGTQFSINTKDKTLSKMTCKWIAEKAICLDNVKFSTIVDVLDENDYIREINSEELSKFESPEYRYTVFGDYYVYLCNGEIPWQARLVGSNFIFHTYFEKDVILNGFNIFVNRNEEYAILDLIRSLINTDRFTAEDFMLFFDQEQKRIFGTLDGENDDDIDEDARAAASQLAKQEAIEWLSAKGYDTSNVHTSYSFIEGVRKGTIEYNIVVKSFRSSSKELKINPNEWLHLLKPNSRLMLYMGHMSFAVVDRKALLGNHDFLRLRISSSNFSVDGNKLEESLERLANDIQYFERTHFVFERVHDSILSRANSLDDYGLFQSNSNQEYSAGNDEDIE